MNVCVYVMCLCGEERRQTLNNLVTTEEGVDAHLFVSIVRVRVNTVTFIVLNGGGRLA